MRPVTDTHADPLAEQRFGGIQKLYPETSGRLSKAHVLVVGLGGVGSWTVEALARSGIGELTLLDADELCVSNTNRQLHALDANVGRPKATALAERVAGINPACRVHEVHEFIHWSTTDAVLDAADYDFVVDAIDGVMSKTWLIGTCFKRGIPVIACGGSGARIDPSKVGIVDLADTHGDRLLFFIRRRLRKHFDVPRKGKMGIPCVFSSEPARVPPRGSCTTDTDEDDLFGEGDTRLNCDGGLGAATFVTGVFGFHAASHVINTIVDA